MPERKFVIHDPQIEVEQETAFKAKTDANIQKGRTDYESGSVKPFEGFDPEAMRHQYGVGLELTSESQEAVISRVSAPLSVIADRYEIEGVYPDHGDLTPHVTLQPGNYKGMTEKEIRRTKKELDENKYLHMVARILTGIEFDLNKLILSGRDFYLCAGDFTPDLNPIYKARKLIQRVYERNSRVGIEQYGQNLSEGKGVAPVNYDDIVHLTVGRITALPEDKSQLLAFANEVEETLGVQVEQKPVHLTVASVFEGSSFDFIHKYGGKFKE